MDNRIIAIEWKNITLKDNVVALATQFAKAFPATQVAVFYANSDFDALDVSALAQLVNMPNSYDTSTKMKNFILKYAQNNSFNGFLHIVEDTVALDRDPLDYVKCLERTMSILDYSIHFSTVTDPCNYVFKKFNPRLSIAIDDDTIKSKLGLPDTISFTSHSNTCWTTYDFGAIGNSVQLYDERFSIAMYFIIEYLARRKATKKDGQLYYMNQYLSIANEVGAFHAINAKNDALDQAKMQEEDALFKSMQVDFSPDNNVDHVLDAFYQKIIEKLEA